MAFQHRVNLASFTARLVSVGVCGNTLGVCALLLFRDTLEVPRKLAKSNPATTSDNNEVSIEELLPAVKEWMEYASFKLVNLTLKSLNEYTAEDSDFGWLVKDESIAPCGFSLSRWDFWTRRLVQLIHCNHEQVANKAIDLIRLMAIGDYKLL